MLDSFFAHPVFLTTLAALPLLAVPALWAAWRRRRVLARLGSGHAVAALVTTSPSSRLWRALLMLAGLLFLSVGAAGPLLGRDRYPESDPGQNRDVVVLVDCSRSMLAGVPSRLDLARHAALDLANALEKRGGCRIALVICAARPRLLVPLTADYARFRAAVDNAESFPDDPEVRPEAGKDTSGTRLGRGITAALAAQDERSSNARDIVLLSDGDDPVEDEEWLTGATAARDAGIHVHVVGLGDPEEALTIPAANGPLMDEQDPVKTRLEEAPLREIARLTAGEYLPGHTKLVPLGRIYLDVIVREPPKPDDPDAVTFFRQRQEWFLAPAFVLLASTLIIPDGRRRNSRIGDRKVVAQE